MSWITGIVLVLLMVGTLFAANSGTRVAAGLRARGVFKIGRTATVLTCAWPNKGCPSADAAGLPPANASDLVVTSVNRTSLADVSTLFWAALPPGISATGYTWWWGDGNVTSTLGDSASYAYGTPGIYLVYAQAVDTIGRVHDNVHSLVRYAILPTATDDLVGNYAEVAGSIVANTTTDINPMGVVAPGGFLSVQTWIASTPSNPGWSLSTPSYSLSADAQTYARLSASVTNATGISGVTAVFGTNTPNGSYDLNFALPITGTLNGVPATVWSNFTFTALVVGDGAAPTSPLPSSPHPGSLHVFMDTRFATWDPSIEYEGTDDGLLQNVLQTLIFRNQTQDGSSPENYVPDLATCVPGSSLCEQLYGSSLIDPWGNYTFVLNPNATFYDPSTARHWRVYPNDVAFSLARACLVADWGYPSFVTGDWNLCQTILPGPTAPSNSSNLSWDEGLHYPYNGTPANILAGILVNDTSSCPPSSPMRDGIHGNGCITFVTSRSGTVWPQFIDSLANPMTGILSCSWVSAQGFGLPGWTNGSDCIGAPPASRGNAHGVPSDTAWDANLSQIETTYTTSPLRWSLVGSGPYYVAGTVLGTFGPTEVTLRAHPFWAGTTCVGGALAGCLPPGDLSTGVPSFLPEATIYVDQTHSSAPGRSALANGTADLVELGPSDMPYLLSQVALGNAQAAVLPTPTLQTIGFNLNYSVTAATQALGRTATLPSTLLQDLNLRQFLLNASPWEEVQRDVCTADGIQSCIQFSGVLPAFMPGYTPSDLTWPAPNPSGDASLVGSAGWWWARAEADGIVSSYCSATSPCMFAVPVIDGLGTWNATVVLWARNVAVLSMGAIQPLPVEVSIAEFLANLTAAPGTSAFAAQHEGWAPDVFDPSNYFGPFFGDQYFGYANDLGELTQAQYSQPCAGAPTSPLVTQDCQGFAYLEVRNLMAEGSSCAPPSCSIGERQLLYHEADHIALDLGLYVPAYQVETVFALGPWIDPTSIARDPMTGSFGNPLSEPLSEIRYLSAIPPVYPLVTGAPVGFAAPSTRPVLSSRGIPSAPSSLTLETGEAMLVVLGLAGGSGVYAYRWGGLPAGCVPIDSIVLTCAPVRTGSTSLLTNVSDTAGRVGTSPSLLITVLQGPLITAFGASPSSLALGSNVTFSLASVGGLGGLRYSYTGLPSGCADANRTILTCTPSAAGTFNVTAFVEDGIGVVARSYTMLTISAPAPFPWIPTGIATGAIIAGGVLAGLHFTRISRETIFATKVRQVIYEYIESNQGASFSQIRNAFGLTNGRATYHLGVLEKQGFLHSETRRRRHMYFTSGNTALWRDLPVSSLQESILKAVRETPGVGVRDLGRRLGRNHTSIGYNVRMLTRDGRLRTEREGLRVRCFVTDDEVG